MRDLYKALGISPSASSEDIASRIRSMYPSNDVKRARDVLLVEHRRRPYDRVHHAVAQISQLRAKVGLDTTAFALAPWHADFMTESAPQPAAAPRAAPPPQKAAVNSLGGGFWLFVVLFVLGLIVVNNFGTGKPPASRTATRPATTPARPATPAPVQPALIAMALPGTGQFDSSVTKDNTIKVVTPSGSQHLLVKVETLSGREVTRGFIRAGDSHIFGLPLGTYVLKTASGTTWYGPTQLFGAQTAYAKADDTFPLNAPGDQWTVTLIPQRQGNLRQVGIKPADF
jgi:hypothetical protein